MKDRIIRADEGFEEMINKIIRERIAKGYDRKPRSTRRITLALRKHPLTRQIEEDLIRADLDASGLK